jgi:hypothetical protein
MIWTTVPFGKHQGKTLPQIVIDDPDWFFWILPRLYGRLKIEARPATCCRSWYEGS